LESELEITDLCVAYGPVRAVKSVSLSVPRGSVVALIGANGAGKSSLFRGILGAARTTSGQVLHRGERLRTNRKPHQVVRRGIAYVPEGRHVIAPLTVEENILLTSDRKNKLSVDQAFDLFPRLAARRRVLAGALSGGEQQMLVIGRALASNPTCILLDEPSMGLAPIVIQEIYQIFSDRLRGSGTTFLLAEQSAVFALRVADMVGVLSVGQLVYKGTPSEVSALGDLAGIYFGASGSAVNNSSQ